MKRRDEIVVGATVFAALALIVFGAIWLSEAELGKGGESYVARFRTVGENLALGLRRRGLSAVEIADRSAEALELVGLPGAEPRYPSELSGGMRKRVGLARAIALRPRYILYDEPTTGLDPVTAAVIDQLIVRTRQTYGVTGLVVTHDMRSAYTVGDRIAMLFRGRIRQVGTVAQIRESHDAVVRQFIEGRPEAAADAERPTGAVA